jgi:hypothetical protein
MRSDCNCTIPMRGGACPCDLRGGYRATKRNRALLRRWKRGERIGFTATSSLKAKGLIPRTSKKYAGKKIVSVKYTRK